MNGMTLSHAARTALAAAALSLLASSPLLAQAAPVEHGDTSIFRRLDLRAPNEYRSASGKPGPAYWQQRADYKITTSLDTVAKAVSGQETLTYTNNSPDTLSFLWLQVDQNLYRENSRGSFLFPENARFAGGGFQGGMDMSYVRVAGRTVEPYVNGTTMRVDLPQPLAPGQQTTVDMGWSFKVPEHGSDRMGRQGSLYEIAQWYPRVFVYDDVHGWNADPYLGQGEFYREFGSYDVSITAPANYIIAATGTLQNPGDVLTPAQRQRLEQAKSSRTQVPIVTAEEAGTAGTRPTTRGTLTWHFTADSVHDFAWAGAPDFRWDAMASKRGVLCQAYYEPQDTTWQTAADMTCFSIDEYSDRWHPFPWPQATSVAGPVGGMEYPMIVFVHDRGSSQGVFGTIAHEHGHEWFPMLVSSNERRYAWMDEGFNTFINAWANDLRYPGTNTNASYLSAYYMGLAAGYDEPLITPPDRIDPQALGLVGYRKPAMVLDLLRDQVLGPDTFDKAFRAYIDRWAYKHPTPADFIRTMEDVSGQDLSWFFREWVYSNDRLDQAIVSVDQKQVEDGGDWQVAVRLESQGDAVMPVALRITLADGQTRSVKLPVQIWYRGDSYTLRALVPAKVSSVTIDPDRSFPDVDRSDNTWTPAAAAGGGGR